MVAQKEIFLFCFAVSKKNLPFRSLDGLCTRNPADAVELRKSPGPSIRVFETNMLHVRVRELHIPRARGPQGEKEKTERNVSSESFCQKTYGQ